MAERKLLVRRQQAAHPLRLGGHLGLRLCWLWFELGFGKLPALAAASVATAAEPAALVATSVASSALAAPLAAASLAAASAAAAAANAASGPAVGREPKPSRQ